MKKVRLHYRMLMSGSDETSEGQTEVVVLDYIAEQLIEGKKVAQVVMYLIAYAFLQGYNGGCHLLDAEEVAE